MKITRHGLLAALTAIAMVLTAVATTTGADAHQEALDGAADFNDALVTANLEATR